jgi:quinol monooxygenase YgiN
MSGKSFIAELHTRPEKREELIRLQAELKSLVFSEEPDALVYELMQSDEDPNLFQVVATFRDDAAFDHHMHIDFHDRLVPPILECLDGEMKLAFYRSLS